MLTAIVVLVVLMGLATGLLVWAHWPQRRGGLGGGPELDATIDEVGNVDRPRVPGESGIGGGSGGGGVGA